MRDQYTHDYHVDLTSGDQAAIAVDKGNMSDAEIADALSARLSIGRGALYGPSVDCDDDGYAPYLVIPAAAVACVTIRRRPTEYDQAVNVELPDAAAGPADQDPAPPVSPAPLPTI